MKLLSALIIVILFSIGCKKQDVGGGGNNNNPPVTIQKGTVTGKVVAANNITPIKNATVFKGPKTYRTLIAGQEFTSDTTKLGWTEEELNMIVQYADSAAALAHENGLQYVVENSNEAFFGKEGAYYGLNDFFNRAGAQVGWQFDTANPFSGCRVHPSPDSLKAFLQENADNISHHEESNEIVEDNKPETNESDQSPAKIEPIDLTLPVASEAAEKKADTISPEIAVPIVEINSSRLDSSSVTIWNLINKYKIPIFGGLLALLILAGWFAVSSYTNYRSGTASA